MTFKDWKYWLSSLPWKLKWFIYLIVLRPIIDNFYWLKEISPFLSPLIIVGILTPVLCINGIVSYQKLSEQRNTNAYLVWSAFIVIAALVFFIKHPGIDASEFALKLTLPVYLFYFIIRFIVSQDDLHGILYASVLAAYVSAIFLLYEIIFHPIQEVEYSRGVERLRGGYADVMNYGIYMCMGLISSTYFYLSNIKIRFLRINNLYLMLAYGILVIIKINHVASYIVFAALVILFVLYSLRRQPGLGFLLLIVFLTIGSYFGQKLYEESITPMIEKDLLVLEGERETSALLHGRVGRWEILLSRFKSTGLLAKLFGTSNQLGSAYMMSSGAHNDFLRILFTSGWVGLIAYLIFLTQTFFRSRAYDLPESYLVIAAVSATILYSVTTTPTYYANYLYIFLAIMAFFTLPPEIAYSTNYPDKTGDA